MALLHLRNDGAELAQLGLVDHIGTVKPLNRPVGGDLHHIQVVNGFKFFLRDADNIMEAECVLLIGTQELPHGLNCGHCGFATCADRPAGVPCALNSVDVGIAIGSACAIAADHRVDTRVMFSAGLAAQRLGILKGCRQVFAIPVSASSKNPFFDRKPKEQGK